MAAEMHQSCIVSSRCESGETGPREENMSHPVPLEEESRRGSVSWRGLCAASEVTAHHKAKLMLKENLGQYSQCHQQFNSFKMGLDNLFLLYCPGCVYVSPLSVPVFYLLPEIYKPSDLQTHSQFLHIVTDFFCTELPEQLVRTSDVVFLMPLSVSLTA